MLSSNPSNESEKGRIESLSDTELLGLVKQSLSVVATVSFDDNDELKLKPPGSWVSKDKLLSVLKDGDEEAATIMETIVWSQGSHAPLEHVAAAIVGIAPKPPANETGESTNEEADASSLAGDKSETKTDTKKSSVFHKLVCCCRRKKNKWDGRSLPQPTHDVHSCPVCAETYIVAPEPVSNQFQSSNVEIEIPTFSPNYEI